MVWGGNGVGDNSGIFGQRYTATVPAAGPSAALSAAVQSTAARDQVFRDHPTDRVVGLSDLIDGLVAGRRRRR